MPTLVLSPRYSSDSISLRQAALSIGWKVLRPQRWSVSNLQIQHPVAIYAEPLFVVSVSQQLGLELVEPPLDWLTHLSPSFLKRDIWFGRLDQVPPTPSPIFLKPADDKSFPAKIYQPGEEIPGRSVIPDSTKVLSAEPVHFESEFRFFVSEGKARTGSIYAIDGDPIQDYSSSGRDSQTLEEASSFLDEILVDHPNLIPPSTVIDVGFIQGRGWAVIEANPSWGSGRYGCDPISVLEVISRAFLKRTSADPSDLSWVLDRSLDQ